MRVFVRTTGDGRIRLQQGVQHLGLGHMFLVICPSFEPEYYDGWPVDVKQHVSVNEVEWSNMPTPRPSAKP